MLILSLFITCMKEKYGGAGSTLDGYTGDVVAKLDSYLQLLILIPSKYRVHSLEIKGFCDFLG